VDFGGAIETYLRAIVKLQIASSAAILP